MTEQNINVQQTKAVNFFLNEESALGAKITYYFRWLMIFLVTLISVILFLSENTKTLASISFILIFIYSSFNYFFFRQLIHKNINPLYRYVFSFIDVCFVLSHLLLLFVDYKAFAHITTSTLFILPIIILLYSFQYNKRLIIFTTIISVIGLNVLYTIQSLYFNVDSNVQTFFYSSQVLQSVYLLIFGAICLYMRFVIFRLIEKQFEAYQGKKEIETNLALEKQKNFFITEHLTYEHEAIRKLETEISERKKAEKLLKETEKRFKLLTENMLDVFWTMDYKTLKYTYISPSVYNLRGITHEEAMNESVESSLTPQSYESINKLMEEAIEDFKIGGNPQIWVRDLEQYCKDGSTVWIEVAATFTVDEKNEPAEIIGVSRNITERKKTEKELKESEEKSKALINNAQDSIIILQNGFIKYVNKAFCELTEYVEKELIDLPLNTVIDPSDWVKILKLQEKRNLGKSTNSIFSVLGVSKSGKRVYLELNSSTIHYKDRLALLIIIRDTTEQKQAAQRLKESEEKYKILIEKSNDGIVIIQDNVLKFANSKTEQIIGYSVSEILNTNFLNYIAAADRTQAEEYYIKRLKGEKVPQIMESLIIGKYGNVINVEFNNSNILYNGKIAIQTYIRDITERKRAENALREREGRLNAIFENALIGIAQLDSNQRILHCNLRWLQMFGLTQNEMLMQDTEIYTHPDDLQKSKEMYNMLIHNKLSSYHIEKRYKRSSGDYFWCDLSINPIRDLNGNLDSVIAIMFDLTERKAIEEELKRVQEQLKSESEQLREENIRSQFEMLKNQVNPHFLFNSLNVLVSLIKLEPDVAERFTEQLSKVYRYVLENKEKDMVSVKTELDFLQSYIFLLEIRFKDKFIVKVNVEEAYYNYQIPPLTTQMLIENAHKHNTFSKKAPLIIEIFAESNQFLIIRNNLQIRDTKIESTGIGLKNIEKRYSYLTQNIPIFEIEDNYFIAKIPLIE